MERNNLEKFINQAAMELRAFVATKILEMSDGDGDGRDCSLFLAMVIRESIDFLFEFNKRFYRGTKAKEDVAATAVIEILNHVIGGNYHEYTENRAKISTGSDKN